MSYGYYAWSTKIVTKERHTKERAFFCIPQKKIIFVIFALSHVLLISFCIGFVCGIISKALYHVITQEDEKRVKTKTLKKVKAKKNKNISANCCFEL